MKNVLFSGLFFVTLITLAGCGAGGDSAPVITSFSPGSGAVGATVTLTGTQFTGATAVKFNSTSATYTVASATSISATVPSGASSGLITVTTPLGSATSAASFAVTASTGTTQYIKLTAPSGSGPGETSWEGNPGVVVFSGEKNIVKDVIGGDLIGFATSSSGSKLYAYISQNDGTSWSWMNTGVSSIRSASGVAQDADGKMHIVACQDYNGPQYLRLTVARDSNKHVTGFSQSASFDIETAGSSSASQHCQVAAGSDLGGSPVLFWGLYSGGGQIYAGKTTSTAGVSPIDASDFVKLDGKAGETLVVDNSKVDGGDAHNSDFGFAQHPVSKDLWFQWGAMDTGDNTTNSAPLKRLRYTPSSGSGGTVWSAGVPSMIEQFASAGLNPQHFSVASTPNYVWMMWYSNAAGGIVVDRIDGAGTVTTNAFGTISGGYLGWFSLSVDPITENRAWLLGWVSVVSDLSTNTILIKYFNGSTWATAGTETLSLGDPWGLAGSVGWDNGLSVLLIGNAYVPYVATLRTN